MSDQLSLDLDPDRNTGHWRPKVPEYVFFGTDAGGKNEEIAACRRQLIRQHRVFASPIAKERFHISLNGLGSFKRIPSRIPFGARRAGERVSLPAFEAVLTRAVSFPETRPGKRPTVLVAQSDSLRRLGDNLLSGLRQEGVKAGTLTIPHVTLFYGPVGIPDTEIRPIRLWIDRFYLIHSERGLGRYNILGQWNLGDTDVPGTAVPLAFGPMAA